VHSPEFAQETTGHWTTRHLSNWEEGIRLLDRFRPNVIFIDIATANPSVTAAAQYVLDVRKRRKEIVFVLYSKQTELEKRCGTFTWWDERLKHYYRLNKGGTDEQFDDLLHRELEKVEMDLQISGAIRTFENALRGEEPALDGQADQEGERVYLKT